MSQSEPSAENEYHLTSIRFGPLAAEVLERGTSLGVTAKRDLARYYRTLDAERAAMDLSTDEALFLIDALNGFSPPASEEAETRLRWALRDAVERKGLDETWGIDGWRLVGRIESWPVGRRWALIDGVERFWRRATLEPDAGTEEVLREVGLLR